MIDSTQHTSELRQFITVERFEKAYLEFMEQADKNAVSKKANGQRIPYGFTEENRCFNGRNLSQFFGQGAASKSPYINWWAVSIYYVTGDKRIAVGIRESVYQNCNQIGIKPIRYGKIAPNNENTAIFYETTKETVDYKELLEHFLRVCEEIMRLGLQYGVLKEDDIEKHISNSGGENTMKNIILYGPPGTGKTYNTVCYAVAICEEKKIEDVIAEAKNDYASVKKRYDELKNNGRIEFTTFHQSYGYEEFIEGIRPVMGGVENSKTVEYEITDGIFKDFCDKNGTNLDSRKAFEIAWNKMLDNADLENAEFTFTRRTGTKIDAVYANNKFRVEWNGGAHNDLTKTAIFNQWSDNETTRESLNGGSRWLFDARLAIIDEMKKYGLPEYDEKETLPCVFIIDEINRGNISKIFGELITLIEPSKRLGQPEELRSILPYSKKPFGVPDNVYIIGTMNTADRSIAAIDTALRRRFSFKEMLPDASIFNGVEIKDGKYDTVIDVEKMLNSMNAKICVLYDREHTIGHAYFIDLLKEKNRNIKTLGRIFKNNIIPLLQEYFYEDYEKIRLVLGDNRKQIGQPLFFVPIKDSSLEMFQTDLDIDIPNRYEINDKAFELAESYRYI